MYVYCKLQAPGSIMEVFALIITELVGRPYDTCNQLPRAQTSLFQTSAHYQVLLAVCMCVTFWTACCGNIVYEWWKHLAQQRPEVDMRLSSPGLRRCADSSSSDRINVLLYTIPGRNYSGITGQRHVFDLIWRDQSSQQHVCNTSMISLSCLRAAASQFIRKDIPL